MECQVFYALWHSMILPNRNFSQLYLRIYSFHFGNYSCHLLDGAIGGIVRIQVHLICAVRFRRATGGIDDRLRFALRPNDHFDFGIDGLAAVFVFRQEVTHVLLVVLVIADRTSRGVNGGEIIGIFPRPFTHEIARNELHFGIHRVGRADIDVARRTVIDVIHLVFGVFIRRVELRHFANRGQHVLIRPDALQDAGADALGAQRFGVNLERPVAERGHRQAVGVELSTFAEVRAVEHPFEVGIANRHLTMSLQVGRDEERIVRRELFVQITVVLQVFHVVVEITHVELAGRQVRVGTEVEVVQLAGDGVSRKRRRDGHKAAAADVPQVCLRDGEHTDEIRDDGFGKFLDAIHDCRQLRHSFLGVPERVETEHRRRVFAVELDVGRARRTPTEIFAVVVTRRTDARVDGHG